MVVTSALFQVPGSDCQHLSRAMRKPVFGVSDQSDANRPVQSQKKKARSLKFHKKRDCSILRSDNKSADQLSVYCTADLPIGFRTGKSPLFLLSRLISNGCHKTV